MTPTARSLAHLRALGYLAEKVEQRIPIPGSRHVTRDFLGVIDLLAIKPGNGTLGVQVTSGSNLAARIKKAAAEPRLVTWLAASMDNRFHLHGWSKRGARGKRKLWTLRVVVGEIEGHGVMFREAGEWEKERTAASAARREGRE